eukprot:12888083-Prorocentrum_lima.AAC.1
MGGSGGGVGAEGGGAASLGGAGRCSLCTEGDRRWGHVNCRMFPVAPCRDTIAICSAISTYDVFFFFADCGECS